MSDFGFAALAAKLDPEDLEQAIGPLYAACADVIGRFGGTVIRALGDGVLAYFGHPKADEDSAENAVRAALQLLHATGSIEVAPVGRFQARVGVATGLMVVGPLSSFGTREPAVVGEALNLALHMLNAAPANAVLITASTRDLIGRFFHCQQVAPVVVEAGREPAPAWRVHDEVAGLPRFEALRRDGMLQLVGREAEIERLTLCWSKVRCGEGRVIVLAGEAGIGKSRLIVELEERLRPEPHATIRWSGLPQRANAPMAALIDELSRATGFAADDSVPLKMQKLRQQFEALGPLAAEATALACNLLGVPCDDASPGINQLSPQKRKERTLAMLLARVELIVRHQPALIVVEDVHWIDPTSLEFLAMLVEGASTSCILAVIASRPEFVCPWPDHSHVGTLVLSRLSRSDSTALLHQVAGKRRIAASIEAEIVRRADGVPLFIEELTKSLLESGGGDDGGRPFRALAANAAQRIPDTLQGLLLARFDRLERAKPIVQAGAVIGREFSFELLRMVLDMNEGELAAALDELVSCGLVFRRGPASQATFIFKHALVRDAAYAMLIRAQRQKLHAEVARSYERRFPETLEAQPELLAYHFSEAGNPMKAIGYLLAAGERALVRSASTEAMSHLAQARELTASLPQSRERLQFELRLEITLARALLATRGYTAPETRDAYQRARQCCEALDDQASLPLIIHGQWVGAWQAADHQSALDHARQLYLWGERNGEAVGLAVAHTDFGITVTVLGRLAEGRRHLDQALLINNFVLRGRQPFVASDADGRNSALTFMHHCLLLLGFPDQAEARAREAAALKPNNLYSRALALVRMSRIHVFARDARAAAETGLAALRLSEEQDYPHMAATASIYTGWALALRGDAAGGIELCQQGRARLRTLGGECFLPFHLALLAECYEQAGDLACGFRTVAEALDSLEHGGERLWQPEIYRLKGRLLLAGADVAGAQACFAEALSAARQQKAKLLELRAATSIASLLQRERRAAAAHDVLAAVWASFTEGFDFIDLREAKALLETLTDQ